MNAVDVEIVSNDGSRTIKALGGPVITIGRGSDATIVLKHDDVSRRHASVEVSDSGVVVRDLSTNGTFVEGRRVVGEVPLPFNKPMRVGPFTLRFRPAGQPAPPQTRTLVGEVKPPPPPRPGSQPGVLIEQPKIIADGARLSDSVELPPPRNKKPQSAPVVVMPRASAPPVVVAKPGGPVMPLRQSGSAAAASPSSASSSGSSTPASPVTTSSSLNTLRPSDRTPIHPIETAPDLSDQERDRIKRWLRGLLFEALGLPSLPPDALQDKTLAPRVLTLLDQLIEEHVRELPPRLDRGRLRKELADEALGLGPLEDLLTDPTASAIMVVDRATIYVERAGKLFLTGARFSSEEALRTTIDRLLLPVGQRVDEATPMVDVRLPDGSRINVVIPPLARRGPCLTLRKRATTRHTIHELVGAGTLDPRMARFLLRSVAARRNILVAGATGTGKTTLLNVLASTIAEDQRIVTLEEAVELQLDQPHVVALETRAPDRDGRGGYSLRDLVRNALRMRPDRLVVGECGGSEALDLVQAMTGGHDGSLVATHASSPAEALARLEMLMRLGGVELPAAALRRQLASAIHLVVQLRRFGDGARKITSVSELAGLDDEGNLRLEPIFELHRARPGDDDGGKPHGEFRATGYLPSFLDRFIALGLVDDGEYL